MRRLRKHAPVGVPVRLVQRPGVRIFDGEWDWVLGYAGYTVGQRGKSRGKIVCCRIVIDSRLPRGEKWEAIVHEWAHCLDRVRRPHPKDCHDSRWGQHWARAFRASLSP